MRATRTEAAVVLGLCAAALILSRLLTPELIASGPPICAFRLITHLPCPFCGMTTAFTLMARGEALAALQANILGPPMYLTAIAAFLASAAALVTGRGRGPEWLRGPRMLKVVALVIGLAWPVNIAIHVWG